LREPDLAIGLSGLDNRTGLEQLVEVAERFAEHGEGDRFVELAASPGRLVVIGFAEGSIPTIKVNRLLLRNLTLIGLALDPMDRRFPGTARRIGDEIQALAEQGRIRPLIGQRLPFADGVEALRILDRRGAIGKLVVDVRPDGA
jgi:NADPH2:quinone reductase